MNLLVSAVGAFGLLLLFNGVTDPTAPRARGASQRMGHLAAEAGWPRVSGRALGAICMGAGVLGALSVLAVTQNPLLAACGVLAGASAPITAARRRRERRRRSIADSWPDALAGIIAGVRAGMSLPECCRSLADGGPPVLQPGFRAFEKTYAATASFEAALHRLRDELQEPIADRVVAVLLMTHQVGGNDIVRVLRTSVEMVREDGRIRGEVQARWSWTVAAAKVAASAPVVVLMLMSLRPEGATAYSSPTGVVTVGVGLSATWLGYRLMLRAGRLPEDKRLSR